MLEVRADQGVSMKWITVSLLVAMAVPGAAQQNLSEVAGSIKLKKPEKESAVVDENAVGRAPKPSAMTEGEQLLQEMVDVADSTETMVALFDETDSGAAFYDSSWRARVAATAEELARSGSVLSLTEVSDRFMVPFTKADHAVEVIVSGVEALQAAIANNRPVFSDAGKQMKTGMTMLEDALKDMRAEVRKEHSETTPAGIDPLTAEKAIAETCARQYPGGESRGHSECLAAQKAAVTTINGRFSFNAGIDEATFNSIRNGCQFEWPKDFVSRDRCETQRIAAAKR